MGPADGNKHVDIHLAGLAISNSHYLYKTAFGKNYFSSYFRKGKKVKVNELHSGRKKYLEGFGKREYMCLCFKDMGINI